MDYYKVEVVKKNTKKKKTCENPEETNRYCELDLPACWYWDEHQVVHWLTETLGFTQYVNSFLKSHVTGRKLVKLDASHLPQLGVCDFSHIRAITKAVRELMSLPEPDYSRSISLPEGEPGEIYLNHKINTGKQADSLDYEAVVKKHAHIFYRSFGIWTPDDTTHLEGKKWPIREKRSDVWSTESDLGDREENCYLDSSLNSNLISFDSTLNGGMY